MEPADEPFWKILRERKTAAQWLEAGTYSFRCDHCGGITTKKLPARKTRRETTRCNHCKKETEI